MVNFPSSHPMHLKQNLEEIFPEGWTQVGVTGLFYGSTGQLTASLMGIGANVLYVSVASFVMFKVMLEGCPKIVGVVMPEPAISAQSISPSTPSRTCPFWIWAPTVPPKAPPLMLKLVRSKPLARSCSGS